jgi:broad specificity phosphatase PhoE
MGSMRWTRWWPVIVLVALAVWAAPVSDPVWDALRAPGSVIILRHSHVPGASDPPGAKLDDCSTQRNLDEDGRAQARRIGEAFRKYGIVVGAVLSSPRCRCLDTARLAFGRAQAWGPLQGSLDHEARRREVVEIRKAIAEHRSGTPLVLVTHGNVITDLAGPRVPMGSLVVLRRSPDGRHTVAGQLHVN